MKSFHNFSLARYLFLAIAFFIIFTSPVRAKEAILKNIVVTTSNKNLLVYFTVANCITRDMEKAILNGVPVTFTFRVILEEKRSFFPDKTIASFRLYHTLKYDQLKGIFVFHQKGPIEKQLTSKDLIWAEKLMTEVETPVAPLTKLKKGHKYELRLKAELSKVKLPFYLRYILFFSSLWDFETDWYTIEFTY